MHLLFFCLLIISVQCIFPSDYTLEQLLHQAQQETNSNQRVVLLQKITNVPSHPQTSKTKGIALYLLGQYQLQSLLKTSTASTASISTTFDYFNRSASFGNSKAHQILGLIHSMGLLSQPQSEVLSLLHYHFAASGGQSQAAMALGFRYLHGVGVSKNCSRAITYYEYASNIAVDSIDANPLFNWDLPRLHRWGNGGYVTGNQMHAPSNPDVVVTGSGESTPSDTEVMQYLRYSAEKNDPNAFSMLGLIYLHGTRGQERAPKKAYHLLRNSAIEHANAAAFADLGFMVLNGLGSPWNNDIQDYKNQNIKGNQKIKKDKKPNDANIVSPKEGKTASERKETTEIGDSILIEASHLQLRYRLAYYYFRQSILGGNNNGSNGLGYIYLHGLGVEKSWTVAKEHFETAAQAKSIHGIYNMGAMYLQPPVFNYDKENKGKANKGKENKGKKNKGKEKDETIQDDEVNNMFSIPVSDQASPKFDFKKAIAHFRVASKAGHLHAMHKLGHMISNGIGLENLPTVDAMNERERVMNQKRCMEAVQLFKKVSERGKSSELITIAENDHQRGNVISSLWYYTAAADLGYEVAQANAAHLFETIKDNDKNRLGIQYLKQATKDSQDSKELPKELPKSSSSRSSSTSSSSSSVAFSLRLWKWAAMQSNVHANMRVGDMYFYGLQNIDIDRGKAVRMYMTATTYGSAQSMFNVGWHYQYGVGVPIDFHLAKRYYDRSIATKPKEAFVPATFGLFSLYVYSSWSTSSSFSGLFQIWWYFLTVWFKDQKMELTLGNIPMGQVVPMENVPYIGNLGDLCWIGCLRCLHSPSFLSVFFLTFFGCGAIWMRMQCRREEEE